MATIPTPEEVGRAILDVYRQQSVRPGEMILMRQFTTKFFERGYRADDISGGLKWLSEKGFVEQKQTQEGASDALFLTEAGFAAI